MLRIFRSYLLPILWTFSIFLSSYMLFDLLDIDGSNLKIPSASNSVAEERVVAEGERIHLAVDLFAALPTPPQSPLDLKRLSFPLVVFPIRRPRAPFLVSHPRTPPVQQAASPHERDSDPAQPTA
jgi:hypothetical protein